MVGNRMQGVVLAAGRGTRFQPLTAVGPKPLQPVCNKPIIQYQLEAMRDAGIRDVAIVIGPTSRAIADYFGNGQWLGMVLTYVEDPNPAGIASSLSYAEPWISGPFALFLGDIFMALDGFDAALALMDGGAAGVVVVREDSADHVRQNFSVDLHPDGRIRRVIEKPADPPTLLKGIGLYVFTPAIFDAIRRTPRSALRNEVELTDAIQTLVGMGLPVYPSQCVKWDINVTRPEDLLACNLKLLRELEQQSLVGPGAQVHAGAQLLDSVVGNDAVVEAPTVFEECLILPGVDVGRPTGPQRRRIFTDGLVWSAAGVA